MKKTITYLTLVLLAVVQTGAGQYIKLFGVIPNIILTFAVVYSLTNSSVRSAVMGLTSGLVIDVTSAGTLGLNGIFLMYICLAVSYFSRKFYYENKLSSFISVYIYTAVYESLILITTQVIFSKSPFFYVLGRYILVESLINSLIAIPLMFWVKWLNNEYIRGI